MKLEQVQRMKKAHLYTNFPLRAASILTKAAVREFFLVGLFTACRPPLSEISHPLISALRQLNRTQFDRFERKIWYASPCCLLGFITGSCIFGFLRRFEQIDALLRALKEVWPRWTKSVGKLGVLQSNIAGAFISISWQYQRGMINLPPNIWRWEDEQLRFKSWMVDCNEIFHNSCIICQWLRLNFL